MAEFYFSKLNDIFRPFQVSNSVYSLRNLAKLKKQGMLIPDDMMEMIPPLLGEAPSLYLAGNLDVLT